MHFLLRGRISPHAVPISNVVLLTVDQKSLDRFPEVQLFWHPYYAEAIKASAEAGAKVFVLDVAFGVPVSKWEPGNDQMMVEAVSSTSATMPTICAFVPGSTQWPVPLNILSSALQLSAYANLTDDKDDFIRRQELIEKPADAMPMRSMALRAAEKYFGEDAQFRNGRLFLKGREIPIDADRTITINFAGGAETMPRVSLSDFIGAVRAHNSRQLHNWVGGKIVLLGPDSIDGYDRHATPFFTLFSGNKWRTAGVEIHANTINTILTGRYLLPAPEWLRLLCLFLITVTTVSVAVGVGTRTAPAWLAALGIIVFLLTHLFFEIGIILPTGEFLSGWLLAIFGATVYRNVTAEKKSAFFRSAVALFVGKQVAGALDESQHIGLTGKRITVTILFTDIRGFTAFCEEKDPAVVVDLLNNYMGRMVSIIHNHHGHVNKFIGDGILAVFCDDDLRGQPGTHPGDHAIRATRCAIEMVTAPGDFKTGAGLHSGPVVIGNVGSSEKMEFTVLGDTVNLASRLESMNKEQKTKLLLSESTQELLEGQIEVKCLGSVAIRGKTLPMNIYTAASLLNPGATDFSLSNRPAEPREPAPLSSKHMELGWWGRLQPAAGFRQRAKIRTFGNTVHLRRNLAQQPGDTDSVNPALTQWSRHWFRRVRHRFSWSAQLRTSVLAGLMLCAALLTSTLKADPPKEQPVGLIVSAGNAKLLRANTETPLTARAGDILFAGDAIRTETAPASFLFCPAKSSESLAPNGEAIFESAKLRIKTGKISDNKPVASCFLPQLVRVAVASQQHYGVSMTRGLAKPDAKPLDRSQLPADVQAELVPVEHDISADPLNPSNWIDEATIFEKHNLEANALEAYHKAADQWKDAVWIRGRIFALEEDLAAQAALAAAAIDPDAQTFALLIGISKYQKLPQDLWLQYADADASTFAKHLESGRGGGVPTDNLVLLTNEQATTAAVRNAFQTFLRNRAGKKDTVFIMVAGHGTVDTKGSYILTYDSDPQDLSTTAIPMQEIQDLVQQELSKVGRVVLLADVCRAAAIGATKPSTVNAAVERLGEASGEILGLMASRPKEVSYEGPQYGGGHGAFTYSVLKGLEGGADANHDQSVNVTEIIDYVRTEVAASTNNKQHPRDFGNMDNSTPLSDLKKPGITLARFPILYDSRNGQPLLLASAQQTPLSSDATRDVNAFHDAIQAGRILPNQPDSAFTSLNKLQGELTPEQYFIQENRLRVALENQAQQVLLKYLTGDQQPQTQQDFDAGSEYMEAATRLTPESLYLEGRKDFFQGRAMLFTKNYPGAANLLEQSVRIDPGAAYAFNALGISYLEQADFRHAIPAFRDAAHRAPLWSYPLHNLALAYVESGDYQDAIKSYKQAMKITPQYSYLPYNLGLVYQRTNKRKEAEQSYLLATKLAPDSAEPLNALGSLKSQEGKAADAEKLYREALAKNANLLAARHNLALLLASNPNRQAEAITLWRDNLQRNPDYLPSRLSLAGALAQRGDTAAAIEEYQAVVRAKPEYVAARTALADLYIKNHDTAAAIGQLQESAKLDPQSAPIYERIGDLQSASGHPAEAKAAWQQALDHTTQKSGRKRLTAKIAGAAK